MSKLLGYKSLAEFARQWDWSPETVYRQMQTGYCKWPRKTFSQKHKHPLYITWKNMVRRCTNPSIKDVKHYAGRGIGIDPNWQTDFNQFIKDMGERPTPKHSIDRIDNNDGYYPHNCRWATTREQALNKRTSRSVPNIANPRKGRFVGRINILNKTLNTPTFDTVEEAQAHLETLKQLYKEYL